MEGDNSSSMLVLLLDKYSLRVPCCSMDEALKFLLNPSTPPKETECLNCHYNKNSIPIPFCCPGPPNVDESIRKITMSGRIRDYTDCIFIYLFALVFATWLGLVSFVFIDGFGKKFLNQSFVKFEENYAEVETNNLSFPVVKILGFIVREPFHGDFHGPNSALFITIGVIVACTFLLNFLILIRFHPRFSTCIGIVCVLLLIIKMIFGIWIGLPSSTEISLSPIYNMTDFTLSNIIVNITKIIFSIVGLLCLTEVKITAVADLIQKSLHAFFFFLHLTLFGLFMLILEFAVIFLSVVAFYSFSESKATIYFTLFEGWYLCLFIFYYAKTVISPTIATWFRTQNKQDIPKCLIFKNIVVVTRYHFGTISCAAMPIIPMLVTLFVLCKHKFSRRRSMFDFIIDTFLIIYLIWNSIEYALIITSIHGQDLYYSTKRTFQYLTRNSSLSLAFIYIFNAMLLVGIIIMALLASIPSMIWFSQDTFLVMIYVVILMLPVLFLLDVSGQVLLISSMEDVENNDETCEKNTCYQMTLVNTT